MTLIEILGHMSEHSNLNLLYNGNIVERYNGKDSFSGDYNNHNVVLIKASQTELNTIDIYVA